MFDIFKSRSSDEDKGKDNSSKKGETSTEKEISPNKESSAPKIEITEDNPYDKAIESAISEYNNEVDAILTEKNPGYQEKIEFSSAIEYENTFFDKNIFKLQDDLEKNKVLDPAKDIMPRALERAATITKTAESISSAPTLEVLGVLAPDGLESKKLYKEVEDDWNKKLGVTDEISNLSFAKSLESFLTKMQIDSEDLLTRTDQGVLSAIAKILQGEGVKNPIIEEGVKIYEERITKILEEKGGSKGIEPNKEEKQTTEQKEQPTSINTEQKVESVNAPVKEGEVNKDATANTVAPTSEKSVSTIESTKETPKELTGKTEDKSTVAVTKEEIKEVEKTVTKEKEVTTETGTTKAASDILSGTPLEGIMGSAKEAIATVTNEPGKLEGKIDSVNETETKISPITEKTAESITEPDKVSAIEPLNAAKLEEGSEKNPLSELKLEPKALSAIIPEKELSIEKGIAVATDLMGANKPEKKGKIGSMIKSFFSKEKKEAPVALSEVGKMENKVETLPSNSGIKETEIQKLNTALPAATPVKETKVEETKKTEEAPVNKELATLATQQEKIINESIVKNGSDGKIVESIEKIEKNIKHSNEELGKKVDTMIGLLALLNDTLQSPLLVKNTFKNYE